MIRAAAALATGTDAASVAASRVAGGLDADADLAVLFISPHMIDDAEAIVAQIHEHLAPRMLVGCSAEWVIGDAREAEGEPAVSLWAASMPGASVETYRARFFRSEQGAGFAGFPDLTARARPAGVLLLGEPFSFPAETLLQWAAEHLPGVPFVGGMASGGAGPGQHRLFVDGDVVDHGAVGAVLDGVSVRTLVSQGCRPIGRTFVVTDAHENVIKQLASRPAVERLQQVVVDAAPSDRVLAQRGLHIGIVVDEYKDRFERGDFLIRGVLGGDPEQGWLAVGDQVEVGRTVRFQVRDASSADEDLREMLGCVEPAPAGALLFTCNGRGSRLFGEPGHDASALRERFGELPIAGMSCAGEIGPIGGRNALHGFTASVLLLG